MEFILLFACVTAGVLVLGAAIFGPGVPVAERIGQLETPMEAPRPRPRGNLRALGSLVDPFIKNTKSSHYFDRRLSQAGLPWTPGEFVLSCGIVAIVTAVAGTFLTGRLELAVPLFAIGAALPFWRLEAVARKRTHEMNEQLPEAVLLIATALKAGNSLLQALQLIGKQMPEPLAGEIRSTVQEINWGVPFETALGNLKDRIGTVEIEMVVVASLVQRQTGGNLSEILTNVHDMIRDRIRIKGDVQALTAQGRASAAILTCLPPGLAGVLYVLNPAYIKMLFVDPRGQVMLAVAVLMNIVGTLIIRKIVSVKF